jgi:hypothetical protein
LVQLEIAPKVNYVYNYPEFCRQLEGCYLQESWPAAVKTFRTKRDALDWARRAEDEMVRGVYIDRAPPAHMTLKAAMARYLTEVTSTKANTSVTREKNRTNTILKVLGEYSLAAITPQLVADYRDQRMTTPSPKTGKPLSGNTVRLEWAFLFVATRLRFDKILHVIASQCLCESHHIRALRCSIPDPHHPDKSPPAHWRAM